MESNSEKMEYWNETPEKREYYERLLLYRCLNCADNPDHAILHEYYIIIPKVVRWIREQELIHYEPTSPMYSDKYFEDLNLKTKVLDTLFKLLINKPTKVQGTVLPVLVANPPQDVIFQSESGTGKTHALAISLINRIDATKNCAQILFLVPTILSAYRLNTIVNRYTYHTDRRKYEPTAFIGNYFNEDVERIYEEKKEQIDHVVIGTAELILDRAKRGIINLDNISMLLMDDADLIMNTQENWNNCTKVIELLPPACQMVFCSTLFDDSSLETAKRTMKDPVAIMMSAPSESLKMVRQYYIQCTNKEDKFQAICKFYGHLTRERNKIIIFCNEPETAAWLNKMMKSDLIFYANIDWSHDIVACITGDEKYEPDLKTFSPQDRKRFERQTSKLNEFNNYCSVLITTDVLSRGANFESNSQIHVVNFDLPVHQSGEIDFKRYLCRIGQTGRFDKEAIVINLVESEQSIAACREIENYFGEEIMCLNVVKSQIDNFGL